MCNNSFIIESVEEKKLCEEGKRKENEKKVYLAGFELRVVGL